MPSSSWMGFREPGSGPAAIAAGVLAAALGSACGGDERPPLLADQPVTAIAGCEQFSYRPCDILSVDCQRELFGLMACARNEAPAASSIPPVLLMSEAEAVAAVSAASEGLAPQAESDGESFAAQMRAFEMLGLVEGGLIENPSDVIAVTIASVVAFYLIPTREIVIIDRGEPLGDLEANATLAHELVHSMQDARHGFAQFTSAHSGSTDISLAAASVIEGEATFYQLLMLLTYDGVDLESLDYRATLDQLANLGRDMTIDAGSPMLTASGIFPYTHGARYAGAHWLRGQEPALDALYAEPPGSSLEVMNGGWEGAPVAIDTFDTAPEPLAGYSMVADDVAGAWVMFGLLAGLAPSTDSAASLEALARHWQGDRMWIYRSNDGAGSVAALWRLAWDDADAAASVAEYLAGWAPEGAAIDVSLEQSSIRIVAVEVARDLDAWVQQLAAPNDDAPQP